LYKIIHPVNKPSLTLVAAIALVCISGTVFFSVANNKKLVKEKERLILRNDSLHMEQLKIKNDLSIAQNRIDSLSGKKK